MSGTQGITESACPKDLNRCDGSRNSNERRDTHVVEVLW